jgi:hypothetical protein
MGRIARLRRQDHRPASNNNSFSLFLQLRDGARDELPAAAERSVSSVLLSVQSVFQRARKLTMLARRLRCA